MLSSPPALPSLWLRDHDLHRGTKEMMQPCLIYLHPISLVPSTLLEWKHRLQCQRLFCHLCRSSALYSSKVGDCAAVPQDTGSPPPMSMTDIRWAPAVGHAVRHAAGHAAGHAVRHAVRHAAGHAVRQRRSV